MQIEGTPLSLNDSLLYEQFEKDLKFLQLFLPLVNDSCPIKRVELVWAGDGPAGQKFLSTEQALAGPWVNDYGRHEAESCSMLRQSGGGAR